MNKKNEIKNILNDVNDKLIRKLKLSGVHPARILAKCEDGSHIYISCSHLPSEILNVLRNLPGNVGYSKENLLYHTKKLIEVIERLPDESPNKLQPLYRKSDPKETERMVNDWRSSLNSLNVFEGTQPVGELPYHEEEHKG